MADGNNKDITPDNQETIRDDKGRFIPGVSGNPKGRPVNEESPTYWLRKFLDEVDPRSTEGRKRLEEIAIKLATEAYKGESWAIKEVFNRLDGQSPQTVKLGGKVEVGAEEVAMALQKLINDDPEENQSNTDGS